MILANQNKYSISALCAVLQLSRSTFYYEAKAKVCENELKETVVEIFKASRNNYGTRKIKQELAKKDKVVSRRKIGQIMREKGLVSNYTVAQYKVHKHGSNEDKAKNEVNREFQDRGHLEVVVSDLTYVRVAGKWNYVCIILDLFNREIIGHSSGHRKDALLVYQAFASIKHNLNDITIFHTDRGSEFKNNVIDGIIDTFNIQRSLSQKGCPYDNAVAEAAFKVFKTEFIYQKTFKSLDMLKYELSDYINWYNNLRIHSSLGYKTPMEYKNMHLKKVV